MRPVDLMFPPEWRIVPISTGIRVSRRVGFSERRNEMDLPITQEQLDLWRLGGRLIQDALPQLDADQREFLMSGMSPDDWARAFPPEDE